jgi:hypothetical protein
VFNPAITTVRIFPVALLLGLIEVSVAGAEAAATAIVAVFELTPL